MKQHISLTVACGCLIAAVTLLAPRPVDAQRFAMTGAPDTAVLSFVNRFQKAVATSNRAQVAGMVNYPLRVNSRNGNKFVVANRAEFVKRYDEVMTPSVRQVIAATKSAKLNGTRDGVALGDGVVWLSALCSKKQPVRCTVGLMSVNHV